MAVEHMNGTSVLSEHGAYEATTPGFAAAELEQEFEAVTTSATWLESPFLGGAEANDEGEVEALEAVVAELEDQEFEAAIQNLIDGVASRHITTLSLSGEADGAVRADREAEQWMEAIASETDRLFEHLEAQLGERSIDTIQEGELETAAAQFYAEASTANLVGEEFLGKLVKKIGKGISNVVKKGIKFVGNILPFGKLLATLKKLAKSALKWVLRLGINKLPPALRAPASALAKRLLGEADYVSEAELVATEFDARFAEALTSGNEAEVTQSLNEFESEAQQFSPHDAAGELDAARARLADQLLSATAGESPIAEMEEFIPALLPAVKLGITIIGRDKVVRTLGGVVAGLIRNYVGRPIAKQLGQGVADVGLRAVGLEAESEAAYEQLGAEALVGTIEDTIREVAALPAEALAEPARLEAEAQHAFAEAAARHLPRVVLRPDLETLETQEAGTWLYMPRGVRPRYRYKKFSRVFRVPVSRQSARAILLAGGDTLERRMLNAGVRMWPAEAEVQLFETLPGTQLGHIAAFETDHEAEVPFAEVASEFEELTPLTASALLGEVRLGRNRPGRSALTPGGPFPLGTRLFTVKVNGRRVKKDRRVVLRWSRRGTTIELRTHLRLSEREAWAVRRNPDSVVAILREAKTSLSGTIERRVARYAQRFLRTGLSAAQASAIGTATVESMLTVVTRDKATLADQLTRAAADPLQGVTLSFSFTFANVDGLRSGAVGAPTVRVRAGLLGD